VRGAVREDRPYRDWELEAANPTAWKHIEAATDVVELGEGLHTLKDSFSHAGAYRGNLISQTRLITGGRVLLFFAEHNPVDVAIRNPEQGTIHDFTDQNVKRFGVEGGIHSVDWTFVDPEKAVRAGAATFEALLRYKLRTGQYDDKRLENLSREWTQIEPLVLLFARARTIAEKKHWFTLYQPEALKYLPWDDLTLNLAHGK
jgi:hypothetical protein